MPSHRIGFTLNSKPFSLINPYPLWSVALDPVGSLPLDLANGFSSHCHFHNVIHCLPPLKFVRYFFILREAIIIIIFFLFLFFFNALGSKDPEG